jgi:ubiquinol oxidase
MSAWRILIVLLSLWLVHGFQFMPFKKAELSKRCISNCNNRLSTQIFFRSQSDADKEKLNLEVSESIQTVSKLFVGSVKLFLILYYGNRPYARFAALETIARVPYFSYTSVLHLYETLGWFRKKQYIEMHFAESWNELHHLLIMEDLGGNKLFWDRLLAQTIAFFYYWIVVVLYMCYPAVAYDLNKHVENHAFETYSKFLETNGEELKKLPPPKVAKEYYEQGDLYLFDAFHSSHLKKYDSDEENEYIHHRRPVINTLYDVFVQIRDDEAEHASTMLMLEKDVIREKRAKEEAMQNGEL